MTTEQTIQDVAMIARNGIDRIIELERENARLTECLQKANEQTEYFEREWSLRGDRLDDLVMLVSRLAIALKKAAPATDLPEMAMDYLRRNGMTPRPLGRGRRQA
jgi:hypothetical protein